ncbi:MAG: hypothetical protein K2M64_04225 [Clostridia bacterium]|nr:hypothetical protein [Clostridia bacterium]
MKKTTRMLMLLVALVMVFTIVLGACSHKCNHVCPECGLCTDADCKDPACADKCPGHSGTVGKDEDSYLSLADYRAYMKADLLNVKNRIGAINATIDAQVLAAYNAGLSAIDAAKTVANVSAAFNSAKVAMASCIPLASGEFDFTGLTPAQKTEILGILESYAINAGLTGVTLFENGGYVMYNPRVTLGTENYISGYGFGTLAEGAITAPLASESNDAWKMYYHSVNAADPGTANYLNDKGSEVSDFYGYLSASYFSVFMNATKDGYDWVPELAKGDVEPVGQLNASGQTNTWRFEIHTDLKYNTLTTDPARAAFNGRTVQAEDYLTPFKLMLNSANNYARGSELANASGASTIAGAKEYYNDTQGKSKGILSNEEADFGKVGVKIVEDGDKTYLQITLGQNVTKYYARYYVSSSLYMPIPAEFIDLVGVDYYLGFSSDKKFSPVDNSLSLGAYTLERWDANQQVVYKKNPNYVYADSKYSITGLHINILPGMANNQELAFNEFLDGKTDAASIPDTKLAEYQNDPRTRTTTGDSCFKLNMNALNAADWEKFFGEDGSISLTPANSYWTVEPAMSNAHFRSALSYAFNRDEFAAIKGSISSVDFFSSDYMSDPENGIAYNATQAHKNAVADLLLDTQNGYSLELARDYFRMALAELEAAGAYKPGTKENPTVIELEIAWMYPQHNTGYHQYVKKYWEDAFNDDSVSGGAYKLEVKFEVGNVWSDVYYNKMMIGQYDIGFGSISGNTLDPLAFMNVLSSDPVISGAFTLNWAFDTNDPNAEILVYNGMRWSYDALYMATQEPTTVTNGAIKKETLDITTGYGLQIDGDDKLITIIVKGAEGVTISEVDFVAFATTDADNYSDYYEFSIMDYLVGDPVVNGNRTSYTFRLTPEALADLPAGSTQGIDIYVNYTDAAGNEHIGGGEKPGYPVSSLMITLKEQVIVEGFDIDYNEEETGVLVFVALDVDESIKDLTLTAVFVSTDGEEVYKDVEFTFVGLDEESGLYILELLFDGLEDFEYCEYQFIEVYASYTSVNGNEIEDQYLGALWVDLIDAPEVDETPED